MNDHYSTEKVLDNKKRVILSVLSVLLLIVAVLGVTYAVFVYIGTGSVKNTITTGTITFTYTSDTNGISITNAEPILDSKGKIIQAQESNNGIAQGYFDFTVSATLAGTATINYEVNATYDTTETSLLDPQFVKVYLTDGKTTETAMAGYTGSSVPTYSSLTNSTITTGAKKLYQGSFSTTGSQKFRLRIWVADNYTINDVSKTFTMRVNVTAST